jgi:hypothetical protein
VQVHATVPGSALLIQRRRLAGIEFLCIAGCLGLGGDEALPEGLLSGPRRRGGGWESESRPSLIVCLVC